MKHFQPPGAATAADVIVIVRASLRSPTTLRRCLDAIELSTASPGEIFLVGNNYDDDESRCIAREFGRDRSIALPSIGGEVSACNALALRAKGRILFFVNADIEVRSHTIAQVVAAMNDDPNVAVLIGSLDDSPADPGLLSQYCNLREHFIHQRQTAAETRTFWSRCVAIRANAFAAVGGFDAGALNADVEFALRLHRAGRQMSSPADLQVKHIGRWSLASMLGADLYGGRFPSFAGLVNGESAGPKDIVILLTGGFRMVLAILTPLLLACSIVWPPAAAIAMVTGALWLRSNAALFNFFEAHHGRRFAVASIAVHWLHSIASGLGMVVTCLRRAATRLLLAAPSGSTDPSDGSVDLHG